MLGAFFSVPRELDRLELLDRPGVPGAELSENLRDIARLNRLGPTQALLAHLGPFLARFEELRSAAPFRVLDLGTGAADIPVALVRWARARGRRVSVLALDAKPDVLACADPEARGLAEVRLVAADALRPPVRPGRVDVAICSLVLHHLPEDAVVALLGLMADLARLGFVVSDLRRSRVAVTAIWLATRAISRNRLTRHDGPLSVRRAYTLEELGRLSAAAGLPEIRWRRGPCFRVLGVYHRQGGIPPIGSSASAPRACGAGSTVASGLSCAFPVPR